MKPKKEFIQFKICDVENYGNVKRFFFPYVEIILVVINSQLEQYECGTQKKRTRSSW